jgi:hypothetical protein
VSGIDTAAADSLKALDPERPIREADMAGLAAGTTRSRMTHLESGVCIAAVQDAYAISYSVTLMYCLTLVCLQEHGPRVSRP